MAIPVVSSSAAADRVQVELLRQAGAVRRFELARSLSASAISLARAAIRERDPGSSEREVLLRFAESHYGAALAGAVRRHLGRAER